ncbi:MAG: hypothetical protein QGH60_15090 [Phycisphaerae bacterium]|jgi:uncharacterized membrane protein|nr:hypothetical protein [Phycisphaerae bacterium]
MAQVSLEFDGIRNLSLLITLLLSIASIMIAAGIWQFVKRRVRQGVICLAAGLGPPAMIPTMLVDSALRYRSGDSRGGRMSWLVAVIVAVATTLAAGAVVATGSAGGMFWLCVLVIEVALAIGVFYASVFSHLGVGKLISLMALRCAAILALMLILFKPVIRLVVDTDKSRPLLPILVDRSASMGTIDQGETTRYSQVVDALTAHQERIERYFRPRWFHFAKSTEKVDSLDELTRLTPSGEGTDGTDLAEAVSTAGAVRDDKEEPAGILLFSDGNPTKGSSVAERAREAAVPTFAVGVGGRSDSSASRPNIEIVSAHTPFEAVKNNVTTLDVRLRITGMPNSTVQLAAREVGIADPVAQQGVTVTRNVQETSIRLKYTPGDRSPQTPLKKGQPDIRMLTVAVAAHPKEAITDDNSHQLHVLITEPRIRVLYIEGSIRPEYKPLRRVFDSDPNVQLMSLIRMRESQFQASGSIGGRKLLRLPTTKDDFDRFDVLILGDLDRTYLSDRRMGDVRLTRIKEFVEGGGALLMLSGANSFGPGGYANTPVEQVLPVLVGPRTQENEATPFLPQLTAEGAKHKIFDGIDKYMFGPGGRKPDPNLPRLPDLNGCATVLKQTLAAEVLAVHPSRRNANGPLIVLAVRQFVGEGRSAVLTANNTSLWNSFIRQRGGGESNPYQQFWGQLVRWLAGVSVKSKDATPSVVLRMDRSYAGAGQPTKFMARVLDADSKTDSTATVSCLVTPIAGEGPKRNLSLVYKAGTGLFEYDAFHMGVAGKYQVVVTAVDNRTSKTIGRDEMTLIIEGHSQETDRVSLNTALLARVAGAHGGQYAELPGLNDVITQLIARGQALAGGGPKMTTYRLYNFTLLFLVFVGLLTTEWILRRNWQLH